MVGLRNNSIVGELSVKGLSHTPRKQLQNNAAKKISALMKKKKNTKKKGQGMFSSSRNESVREDGSEIGGMPDNANTPKI